MAAFHFDMAAAVREMEAADRRRAAYRAAPSPSTLHALAVGEQEADRRPLAAEYHMACALHEAWVTRDVHDFHPSHLEHPTSRNMTEEEALTVLEEVIDVYPRVAAWVQYRSVRRAVNLRWPRMAARLAKLCEARNQWFTPAGDLCELAETRERFDDCCGYIHRDCPPPAVEGPWNYPLGRDHGDTMNVQHAVQSWLEEDPDVDEDVLERALFCNSGQLACAECDSFHGGPDAHHCVVHGEGRDTRWHTRRSVCPDCGDAAPLVTPVPAARVILRTLTRGVLRRRARLRGVLRCAVRLLILYRLDVKWRPGCSGYAEAEARWLCRNGEHGK